jgi:hypothetical protein
VKKCDTEKNVTKIDNGWRPTANVNNKSLHPKFTGAFKVKKRNNSANLTFEHRKYLVLYIVK